jgi:hypothetical protein
MDLREIGWGDMDWTDLVQDRDRWKALVNTLINIRVPQNFGKFFSSCATGGFSIRPQLREVSYICHETYALLELHNTCLEQNAYYDWFEFSYKQVLQ